MVTAGSMRKTMQKSATSVKHQDETHQPNGKDNAKTCIISKAPRWDRSAQ